MYTLQMLQKDFISQKKQWEEELARSARKEPPSPEEDDPVEACQRDGLYQLPC